MSTDYILEARGLSKQFHSYLEECRPERPRRSIHALIGPSSRQGRCFNLLSTFLRAAAGRSASTDTRSKERPATVARSGLVRSFQISAVFGHMTCGDVPRRAWQTG
jgi:branched-chain amino acid transport system ATP-binding protein